MSHDVTFENTLTFRPDFLSDDVYSDNHCFNILFDNCLKSTTIHVKIQTLDKILDYSHN